MYIKLIQPKMKKRPVDTDLKTHMSPPLGLYTIANMLRNNHKISVENENIRAINFNDKPDAVGISITVDTLPRAIVISRYFRKRGIPVIAGGIFVTTAWNFIPENSFDALCIGAAELTWNNIADDLQNGCLKKVYRCPNTMSGTDIISPAYDMIKNDSYLYCNIVHTSRGCPFKCDFCYNSAVSRKYINRPVDDVIKDIENINSKHIMFIDDNFTGNIKWTREFLKRIKPMKLKWNCAVSINIVNHEKLLEEMRACGCQSLFIGFESINSSSISGVHKIQNQTQQYDRAVEIIHSKGIMINASFVFGLDGDTIETFKYTLDWIVKNKIETVTSHILTPYPGTKLYDEMKKAGRITSDNLTLYNTANVVFRPQNMTPQELYEGYLWIYKNVYSFKNIIKRIPDENSQILPYLLFNFLYRKYGRFTEKLCRIVTYNRIGRIADKISGYVKR